MSRPVTFRVVLESSFLQIRKTGVLFVMKISGEGEVVNTEQTVVEEVPVVTEKQVKEKKVKVTKEKMPKEAKTASHPPYFQMIKEALLAFDEKSGSSPYAIAKYMEEKHKEVLPGNFKKIMGLQLKNSAAKGKLIKIKASYKLSEAGKKEKVTDMAMKVTTDDASKKRKATTAATKTKAVVKKSETTKKIPVKKVGAKRMKKSTPAKAKQLKSIKSPAAKRGRKTTA